jgi:hypothetical protein
LPRSSATRPTVRGELIPRRAGRGPCPASCRTYPSPARPGPGAWRGARPRDPPRSRAVRAVTGALNTPQPTNAIHEDAGGTLEEMPERALLPDLGNDSAELQGLTARLDTHRDIAGRAADQRLPSPSTRQGSCRNTQRLPWSEAHTRAASIGGPSTHSSTRWPTPACSP